MKVYFVVSSVTGNTLGKFADLESALKQGESYLSQGMTVDIYECIKLV